MTSRRREMADRRRNQNRTPGPPPPGGPEFLLVGVVRRPHGVKGEVLLSVETDFPERLQPDTVLYVGEQHEPHTLTSRRGHNDGLLVRFDDHARREDVDGWNNLNVYVRTDDRPPLPEGQYYLHQLLGLKVVTEDGATLGTVTEVLDTGANSVYVVNTPEGKEILLPAIPDVVLTVDVPGGIMTVRLMDGLV
ncbi:MAG: 16S rRNA processing protein RimM [Anaerolineae bacterium]|nr:MAG: 16S rRNA processing protein RimM [Anaerolineae bacterium]